MTDEEYQRLFTWTEYKQVRTRSDRIVHVFEDKSLPAEFQMGTARFVRFLRNGFRPQYKDAVSGVSLTIDCPQYKDRLIDTPAYWVASTPQYKDAVSGVSLTIDCPQYKDRLIDTPAYWVASTPSMGPVASRHRRTPMLALAALRDDLLEIVSKGQQAQKSCDIVSAMLTRK
jgi:hypothetical protein